MGRFDSIRINYSNHRNHNQISLKRDMQLLLSCSLNQMKQMKIKILTLNLNAMSLRTNSIVKTPVKIMLR
jgi:hypothetical protein